MHSRQQPSRRVQFRFADKSDWERADRKSISGPKQRKERSRKRKERSRKRKECKRNKKKMNNELDAFRHFLSVKNVDYYSGKMKNIIATLNSPLNVKTLLPKFIDRVNLASHATLEVEDGVNWPQFFASLLESMKSNYTGTDNEYTTQGGDEQMRGVDANDTAVLLPLVCDGDLVVHGLFLLDGLDALIDHHVTEFVPFFEVAYGANIEYEDAAERFLERTLCVTESAEWNNAAMELHGRLRFVFTEQDRDANSQADSTDGSTSAGGNVLAPDNADRDADQVKKLLVAVVLVLISMLIKITTGESE